MANVCALTRRGYRDVSLNKIIIKTKAPPIRPFPRAALVSIQIDPRSALRGFIAGVLQFGDASELHYCRLASTFLVIASPWRDTRQVAERLGQEGIFVWDGNYHALAVTERLGVEASGGMIRVGIAHYNTLKEVEQLLAVVDDLVGHSE